jgi:hypothetical protein
MTARLDRRAVSTLRGRVASRGTGAANVEGTDHRVLGLDYACIAE